MPFDGPLAGSRTVVVQPDPTGIIAQDFENGGSRSAVPEEPLEVHLGMFLSA